MQLLEEKEEGMTDDDFLKSLTKNARRYLSHFACSWCEHQMSRTGCGGIYHRCDHSIRIERAKRCLLQYRPRKEKTDDQDAPGSA
jgi:hypothetical protein